MTLTRPLSLPELSWQVDVHKCNQFTNRSQLQMVVPVIRSFRPRLCCYAAPVNIMNTPSCSEECLANQRLVEIAVSNAINAARQGNPAAILRKLQASPKYEHDPNCPAKGTDLPMERMTPVIELKRRSVEPKAAELRCSKECLRHQARAEARAESAQNQAINAAAAGNYVLSSQLMNNAPGPGHHPMCPIIISRRRHAITTLTLPPEFVGNSTSIARSVVPRRQLTPHVVRRATVNSSPSPTGRPEKDHCSTDCYRFRELLIANRAIDTFNRGGELLADQVLDEHHPECPAGAAEAAARKRQQQRNVWWWRLPRTFCCIPSEPQ
jgi:hypothetical protein